MVLVGTMVFAILVHEKEVLTSVMPLAVVDFIDQNQGAIGVFIAIGIGAMFLGIMFLMTGSIKN